MTRTADHAGLGFFQRGNRLIACDAGEIVQELFERGPPLEPIEQGGSGHASTDNTGAPL